MSRISHPTSSPDSASVFYNNSACIQFPGPALQNLLRTVTVGFFFLRERTFRNFGVLLLDSSSHPYIVFPHEVCLCFQETAWRFIEGHGLPPSMSTTTVGQQLHREVRRDLVVCDSSNLCGQFIPSNVKEYGRGLERYAWKGR